METTYIKGKAGERLAERELGKRGISIVERNFRSPEGEVDLVGVEHDTVVFIEVKSWRTYAIDSLEQSLNEKKRARIIETAKFFLQKHREYMGMAVRFDVVFVGHDAVTHIASAWVEAHD